MVGSADSALIREVSFQSALYREVPLHVLYWVANHVKSSVLVGTVRIIRAGKGNGR